MPITIVAEQKPNTVPFLLQAHLLKIEIRTDRDRARNLLILARFSGSNS